MSDLKIMAYLLYEKYVKVGSEFEINISSVDRNKMIAVFHDLDVCLNEESVTICDILMLFNKGRREMKKLLLSSLWRFKSETL